MGCKMLAVARGWYEIGAVRGAGLPPLSAMARAGTPRNPKALGAEAPGSPNEVRSDSRDPS